MRTTGIVRKIDMLGRVVIPKEIRKTLRIRDNDSLEIFVHDDYVMFKKYNKEITTSEAINNLKDVVNNKNNINHKEKVLQQIKDLEKMLISE